MHRERQKKKSANSPWRRGKLHLKQRGGFVLWSLILSRNLQTSLLSRWPMVVTKGSKKSIAGTKPVRNDGLEQSGREGSDEDRRTWHEAEPGRLLSWLTGGGVWHSRAARMTSGIGVWLGLPKQPYKWSCWCSCCGTTGSAESLQRPGHKFNPWPQNSGLKDLVLLKLQA